MPAQLDPYGLLPTLTVEVDKTNQPTNPTRVWTDITSYVRNLTASRSGRNDEFQRTTPGMLQLVLNNRDDAPVRFETLGVNKAQWIRVSATWQGTTYRVWQGIVEELVRQWPSAGKDATINLTATDALKLCRLYDLAGSTFPAQRVDQRFVAILAAVGFPVGYANAVKAMGPSLYWRLDETSGTNAADSSGFGRAGTYGSGVTKNQTSLLTGDADASALFNGTINDLVSLSTYSPWLSGKNTIVGLAKRTGTANGLTLTTQSSVFARVLRVAIGSNDVVWSWNASSFFTWPGAWPGTGVVAHWALTTDTATGTAELFINGVSQGAQTLNTSVASSGSGVSAFGSPATLSDTATGDEFAIFEAALPAGMIRGLYLASLAAGVGTFDTDTDTFDAVTTPLSTGSDALAQLLALEGTTNGLLIANGDGSMTFQGRHWRLTNAKTPAATFTDDGTGIPYRDSAEYQDDDTRIANVVNVTPLGASTPVTVNDATSQSKYFSRTNPSVDRSLLSSSASLALSAAQYLLDRYKDPSPRIPTLEVSFQAAAKIAASYGAFLLNAANSQRFTWKRTTAAPINRDVYVEQVTHTVDPRVPSWTTTLMLSPADAESNWVLGDATLGVLGSTTKLAY